MNEYEKEEGQKEFKAFLQRCVNTFLPSNCVDIPGYLKKIDFRGEKCLPVMSEPGPILKMWMGKDMVGIIYQERIGEEWFFRFQQIETGESE